MSDDTRRWLFAVLPDGQSARIHLDPGGNERADALPWTGSLDAAHQEATMRVGLWEDRTGQTAYRVELVSLGRAKD